MLALLTLGACDKNMLNKSPLDKYSDANVWKDSALIYRFVDDIYSTIISEYDDESMMATMSMTDEGKVSRSYYPANNVNTGQYTAADNLFEETWDNVYKNVRKCNVFLSHMEDLPLSPATKVQLEGEARFLRALNYMELYSYFGVFPIVDKVLNVGDEELSVGRGTEDECFKFMLDDLQAAEAALPESYSKTSDIGRATKGAAIGMQCRLYLNARKYQEASDAAEKVMALNYSLFPDYAGIFFPENDDNSEVIFNKEFGSEQSAQVHSIDIYENSSYFTGFNSVIDCPTQNIVDQYLMTDGLPWNESPLYSAAHPYANRDPRFDASIMHDGSEWMGETIDMKRGSPFNPTAYGFSLTGYMMRKLLNPNYVFYGDNPNYQNAVMLRLGEIYLNYAECQLKLGHPEEARIYVNKLRDRAGMPQIPMGQMTWDAYVGERTVELAFEGQRWNDIRRWQTGATMLGSDIYSTVVSDGPGGRVYDRVLLEKRFFDPKMYLFPIPIDEILKYPAGQQLEQNPGWQ